MTAKPCTARIAWGAFATLLGYPTRPNDMPRWHRCTHARGHEGHHRAEWQGHVYEWEPMVGGVREGAGRPRLDDDERRTERVVVRVRGDELRALESAAGSEGVGPWLRRLGLRATKRRRSDS